MSLPSSMPREKKPLHKVQMTESKSSIIRQLLEEYEIETAGNIQEALKDLLGGTIKEMMETEMDVLSELKNREVKDILVICADGRTHIKEAITVTVPMTEYQCCIVHQVRNTLKYVADKDCKPFAADLNTIYHAETEEKALEALKSVTENG